jgi:hypothetical protein
VKKLISAAACCSLLAAARLGAQNTLDFEDLLNNRVRQVPAIYHGFGFYGGFVSGGIDISWVTDFMTSAFAVNKVHSGQVRVWSRGGTWLEIANPGYFDFFGVWLSAQYGSCDIFHESAALQPIRGFKDGVEVYNRTVEVSCSQMNLHTLNFHDVDRVRFDEALRLDGTPWGVNLVVDDIIVSPEPGTIVLLATGFAGLFGARLRRKQKDVMERAVTKEVLQ